MTPELSDYGIAFMDSEIKRRTKTIKTAKPYPTWVCYDCGIRHGNKPFSTATWHAGDECGVCGKAIATTEPRDCGHLKQGWDKK